jgi:hypothetical protein
MRLVSEAAYIKLARLIEVTLQSEMYRRIKAGKGFPSWDL